MSKYALNNNGEFDLNMVETGEVFNWCCVAANLMVRESQQHNVDGCKIKIKTPWDIPAWEKHLKDYSDGELINLIKYGFPIECYPKGGSDKVHRNHKGATDFPDQVQKYIERELKLGSVIGPFKHNPFGKHARFSPVNTRNKKDSDEKRVILDLSWPQDGTSVNQGIDKNYYRGLPVKCELPTVHDLVKIVVNKGKGCLVFKRDLKRAYKQIGCCIGIIHVLGFYFNERYYYDITLPMGLINSALVCQKISSAIAYVYGKEGFAAINYLDDFGGAEQQHLAEQAYQVLALVLKTLGVKESIEKANPPSMWTVFLGILINTWLMRLEIQPERLVEIKQELNTWLNKPKASLRQLQSLIGKLSFCVVTMRAGKIFYARILSFIRTLTNCNPWQMVTLPQDVYKDVQWWVTMMSHFNGISMIPDSRWIGPNRIIQTDACLTGIGGWSQGEYFHKQLPVFVRQQHLDINCIECLAIVVALKQWGYRLNGANVLMQCDNSDSVQCINSAKARNKFMQTLIREICYLCAINDCYVRAVFLDGNSNRIADALSRWHLSPQYAITFDKITRGIQKKEIKIQDQSFLFSNPW